MKKVLIYLLVIIVSMPNALYAQNTNESNYRYDYWGRIIEDIPFFDFYKKIDQRSMQDVRLASIDDLAVAEEKIYIVDRIESRVNIFDKDLAFQQSIKVIRSADGRIAINPKDNQQVVLNGPEGIFIHESEKEIYIADTGNQRIVVLDQEGLYLKRIIEKPEDMIGQTVFNPSKIAVDSINRIYVVVQSGFEGIIELNQAGEFNRYFGVNKPEINLLDYFWRQQATEEQRKKMQKFLAPSFNNIDIDQDGFIYATTFDSSAQDVVFRFNPRGENILRQKGFTKVVGDLDVDVTNRISQFVDIALTDYGTYAVLDRVHGRIFVYNFDGELMNVFGSRGYMEGELREPTAIAWFGDKLIVADKQLKTAYVYKPTQFGSYALSAAEAYYHGEWDRSTELLLEAVALNKNYDMAYSSIGKAYLMKDRYEEAMYYFKLGDNRPYYSKAFEGYRGVWISRHFPWIFSLMILGILSIIWTEVKYHKKQKQ